MFRHTPMSDGSHVARHGRGGTPPGARGRCSDDGGDLVAGVADALAHVDPRQQHAAEDEEHDQGDDGRAVGAGELVDQAEEQRARTSSSRAPWPGRG